MPRVGGVYSGVTGMLEVRCLSFAGVLIVSVLGLVTGWLILLDASRVVSTAVDLYDETGKIPNIPGDLSNPTDEFHQAHVVVWKRDDDNIDDDGGEILAHIRDFTHQTGFNPVEIQEWEKKWEKAWEEVWTGGWHRFFSEASDSAGVKQFNDLRSLAALNMVNQCRFLLLGVRGQANVGLKPENFSETSKRAIALYLMVYKKALKTAQQELDGYKPRRPTLAMAWDVAGDVLMLCKSLYVDSQGDDDGGQVVASNVRCRELQTIWAIKRR
eukprot:gene17806-24184_t